jgi:hypothetical protein
MNRFLFALLIGGSALPLKAATFVVTTAADSGPGSLRQAMLDANATSTPDEIDFNISPPGVHVITPLSPLPTITQPLHINGRTQPGYTSTPLIQLNGISAGPCNGLWIVGTSNCVIEALSITRFKTDGAYDTGNGIRAEQGGYHAFLGNYIGVNPGGTATGDGNDGTGICLAGSHDCKVGGTLPKDRNLISQNGFSPLLDGTTDPTSIHNYGIHLVDLAFNPGSSNRVLGNFIGTDATGLAPLGNHGAGIMVVNDGHVIGGVEPGARNVVAANGGEAGIFLSYSFDCRIQGNLIGTGVNGVTAVGNLKHGVCIGDSIGTLVGGPQPAARNIISGNVRDGVNFTNSLNYSNYVQGNFIGTDISGASPLANGRDGVYAGLHDNSYTRIGGTNSGEANIIAFNARNGVTVAAGSDCTILCNSIHDNRPRIDVSGLGIDLGDNNVTENDSGDTDLGANALQNFPFVTGAYSDGYNIYLTGKLESEPNRPYLLQFFWNNLCDLNNHGEGQFYIGQQWVTTAGDGKVNFSATFPGSVPFAKVATATATSTNANTSEFSFCHDIVVPPPVYIRRDTAGTITIFWSSHYGLWVLQRSPTLTPAVWADDPNPVTLVGDEYVVTEPATTSYHFRLRSP